MTSYDLIETKNIKLKRLGKDNIEQVRLWRNSESVKKWMEFQEEISQEAQLKWFNNLDQRIQFYYIIEYKGKDIGLVNIKNIKNSSGEGGIFIAEQEYLNGTAGLEAILAMYDYGFNVLNLNCITAHILESNTRAIRFNRSLGFKKLEDQEGVKNQKWAVERDDYFSATKKLKSFLSH